MVFDKLRNSVSTLEYAFYSSSQSYWSTDLRHGLEIHFAAVTDSGREVDELQSDYQTFYLEKDVKFIGVKGVGEGDDKRCYFYVTKKGVKDVFRFSVEVGTKLCPHGEFGKLYLLNVGEEGVRLRVISYHAFSRFFDNYLKNRTDSA